LGTAGVLVTPERENGEGHGRGTPERNTGEGNRKATPERNTGEEHRRLTEYGMIPLLVYSLLVWQSLLVYTLLLPCPSPAFLSRASLQCPVIARAAY
jgi:hypothetical protein